MLCKKINLLLLTYLIYFPFSLFSEFVHQEGIYEKSRPFRYTDALVLECNGTEGMVSELFGYRDPFLSEQFLHELVQISRPLVRYQGASVSKF